MEKIKSAIPTGTKEWASSNVNILSGCSHNCRYCYAKKLALRFGRKTEDTWKIMELCQEKLNKNFKKRKGRVMFPSSHDIVPEFKYECFEIIEKLLNAGNSLLITSKPYYSVIRELCETFQDYRPKIQFRFTITSLNNELLNFWEEGAPSFEERLDSLKFAYKMKFKTSVSIEPFIDHDPIPLVKKLYPYISETIWIGKMNYIDRINLKEREIEFFDAIRENYTINNIQKIINKLKQFKKVRYKDSIKKLNIVVPSYQIPEVKYHLNH